MTDANDLRPQSTDYLLSACWLLRFSILPQTGLFDESIFYAPEDAEFCIRVWEAGYEVTYLPEASVVHCWQRISRQPAIVNDMMKNKRRDFPVGIFLHLYSFLNILFL